MIKAWQGCRYILKNYNIPHPKKTYHVQFPFPYDDRNKKTKIINPWHGFHGGLLRKTRDKNRRFVDDSIYSFDNIKNLNQD